MVTKLAMTPEEQAQLLSQRAELIRSQAYDKILRNGLLFTGVGAGVRGLRGVWDWATSRKRQEEETPPEIAAIPTPVKSGSLWDDAKAMGHSAVNAWDKLKSLGTSLQDPTNAAADAAAESAGWLKDRVHNVATGGSAKTWRDWAPVPAAMLGTTVLGIGGGYKLMDWLMKRRRKQQTEQQLQEAKTRYEQSLVEQNAKQGSLAADLEQLVRHLEKQADLADLTEQAGNYYGKLLALGALGGAGTGAYMGYSRAKQMGQADLARQALAQHRRELYARRPTPIVAWPVSGEQDEPEEKQKDQAALRVISAA